MAPGRGGRGAPEETVVVDGKTLRRVLDEASKRWVYRPVDAASGETISKEDFEARRREEEAARRASDPRHRAAEEKRWLEQQRGDIREKRAEASRAMRREEHHAALRDGRVERRRPRRKGALGVEVPVPDALAELREEMRLATLRETRKKNPGRFAFIETALAVEERKHETALDAARRRAYAAERRRKGVRGGGESGSDSESDDASDDAPPFALRGSAADLDDPDYRRGPPAATNSGTMQNGVPGDAILHRTAVCRRGRASSVVRIVQVRRGPAEREGRRVVGCVVGFGIGPRFAAAAHALSSPLGGVRAAPRGVQRGLVFPLLHRQRGLDERETPGVLLPRLAQGRQAHLLPELGERIRDGHLNPERAFSSRPSPLHAPVA